ncbi:MAG: single-stranded DNA-binding protein [Spirochaetaceae bacterium]|nr:single-stranded DNA-binding protein [Spirochaetaceae bacterium]
MADLNSVSLVGRLTRDVEAPAGNGPARFSVAVNRRVKQGEQWTDEASFFDIEYWHKSILSYLTKGKQIAIRGELKQDRWQDRTTGENRSKIIIVAQDVQLLGGQAQEGQGGAQAASSACGYQKPAAGATAGQGGAPAGKPDDFTDDIPF